MEKSILNDISMYKNRLLTMLLQDDNVCIPLTGFYSNDLDIDQVMYHQVFPYLYIDDAQTEVLTYICAEIDIPRIPTGTIKDMQLSIWVYSHKEQMKYSSAKYSGTMVDILSDAIDRCLSNDANCRRLGIGKLQLNSVNHFFPHNKYYGRQLNYIIPDFSVKEISHEA